MKILKNRMTGMYVIIQRNLLPGTFTPVVRFEDLREKPKHIGFDDDAAKLAWLFASMHMDEPICVKFEFVDCRGNDLTGPARIKWEARGKRGGDLELAANFIAENYMLEEFVPSDAENAAR